VIIGIDTPHKSKADHPRYDERIKLPLNEMRIRDIRTRGVKVPVIFERDGEQLIIVDGIQRIRHAREAVIRQREAGEVELKVRGLPEKGDDKHMFGLSRALNAHRSDDGPLQNARNAVRMKDDFAYSDDEIAQVFGVTPQTVKAWLVVPGLSSRAQTAIESGQLGVTAAVQSLGKLAKDKQDEMLPSLIAGSGGKPATVREAKNKVREAEGKAPIVTPSGKLTKVCAELNRLSSVEGDQTASLMRIPKEELVATLIKMRWIIEGRPGT